MSSNFEMSDTLSPAYFQSALQDFETSSSTFQLLYRFEGDYVSASEKIYILDSSFNPPTLAHQRLAISALKESPQGNATHLMLLLSIVNCDKSSKPTSFDQRLMMMTLFAEDLLEVLELTSRSGTPMPTIDICVTKIPYFHDKAAVIDTCDVYPTSPQQVYLMGYDTLIRFLDTKYYGPAYTLNELAPFFEKHIIRCSYRTTSLWGDRSVQDEYMKRLRNGEMEKVGGLREWADRIEMVLEGRTEDMEPLSSTKVRMEIACEKKDFGRILTPRVKGWLTQHILYLDA